MEHKRIVDRIEEQIPRALEVITDAASMIADELGEDNGKTQAAQGDVLTESQGSSAA